MFTQSTRKSPAPPIVTLEQIKSAAVIADNIDDDYLSFLTSAATEIVERYTRRKLTPHSVVAEVPMSRLSFHLPYPDNINIISVTSGADSVNYEFSDVSNLLTITGPVTESTTIINYDAGMLDGEVPYPLQQAIKVIVSEMYENRLEATTDSVNEVSFSSKRLMNLYRVDTL